jgi:hypothetical protein
MIIPQQCDWHKQLRPQSNDKALCLHRSANSDKSGITFLRKRCYSPFIAVKNNNRDKS